MLGGGTPREVTATCRIYTTGSNCIDGQKTTNPVEQINKDFISHTKDHKKSLWIAFERQTFLLTHGR